MKWEYKQIAKFEQVLPRFGTTYFMPPEKIKRSNLKLLNQLGNEGWECIGMDEKHFLLKRMIYE